MQATCAPHTARARVAMAAKKPPSHQRVGTLVAPLGGPVLTNSATTPPADVLAPLLKELHGLANAGPFGLGGRVTKSSSHWGMGEAPYDTWKNYACSVAPAHICIAQLRCGTVCVLKIGEVGCCCIYVRMKRTQWEDWAKARKWDVNEARAFRRSLGHEEGVNLLTGARAFCEPADAQVHHPHALSVLCSLARGDSEHERLVVRRAPPLALPTKVGAMELVVVPPSPTFLEECFCLLGHKDTFVQRDWGDEMPLSARVVSSTWGGMAKATTCTPANAKRFQDGADYLEREALDWLISDHLRVLNRQLPSAFSALAALAKQCEAPEVSLAPSDEDEDDDDSHGSSRATAAIAAAVKAAAAPAASASSSAARGGKAKAQQLKAQQPKGRRTPAQSKGQTKSKAAAAPAAAATAAPKAKRARAAPASKKDSDEDAMDSDESDDSDEAGSTSDESAAKDAAGFDDDDSESEAAPATPPPAATPPPPQVSSGLSAEALKAMCQPCCAQLARFLLANDGLITGTRWERLEDDHRLLHEATTAETVVAASLSLARTLMDAHTDPPEDSTVLMSGRERARVRTLAARAVGFAEATLGDLDRAIAESRAQTERLEGARKRGYEALEAVEGGGVGAGPSV